MAWALRLWKRRNPEQKAKEMHAPGFSLGLALSLCLLPTIASAQQAGFPGQWELEGRYTSGRKTAVQLKVSQVAGSLQVTRTGRFTSPDFRNLLAFTWTSSQVQVSGRRMRVIFKVHVGNTVGTEGLIGSLSPNSSRANVVRALTKTNTFDAIYFLSNAKRSISEVVVNQTRLGDDRWWQWASTKGQRGVDPAVAQLTRAEYERVRDETIKQDYLKGIASYYDEELTFTSTAAERRELDEDRALDMDFSKTELTEGDWDFEQEIYERYNYLNEPYLDAQGREIPEGDLEVVTLVFSPQYARDTVGKPYVFDTRTGKLVAEGEITE